MKLYQRELADGINLLEDRISFATQANFQKSDVELKLAIATASTKDFDLCPLYSLLATTGWNNNDDVFLAGEIYKARHTPDDKPCNIGHNQVEIVGHTIGTIWVDFDGNLLNEDFATWPKDMHILTKSVLYTELSDTEYKAKIEKLIAEIADGLWYVSMECLLGGFDYAVRSPQGDEYVIARDEKSSFLTKYLRAYGGSGLWGENRVGRVLRNFTFCGQGLTQKPANPYSVAFLNPDKFTGAEKLIMSKTLEELEAAVASLTKERDLALAQVASFDKSKYDSAMSDLAKKAGDLEKVATASQAEVTSLKEEKTALEAKISELQTALADLNKKSLIADRVSQLQTAGSLTAEELDTYRETLGDVSDAAFAVILSLAKRPVATLTQTTEEVVTQVLETAKPEKTATLAVASIDSTPKVSLGERLSKTLTKKRGGK